MNNQFDTSIYEDFLISMKIKGQESGEYLYPILSLAITSIWIGISFYFDKKYDTETFSVIAIMSAFIIFPVFIMLSEWLSKRLGFWILSPITVTIKHTQEINILINQDTTKNNTINEILNRIDTICLQLRRLTNIYTILDHISGGEKQIGNFIQIPFLNLRFLTQLIKTIKNNTSWILHIITDLRSDLTIRITEQKKLLEGAKSEVEKHIRGTTELESVSELQRTRLDRQIEQFEELQRVLVKV